MERLAWGSMQDQEEKTTAAATAQPAAAFDIDAFFPYRLSALAEEVSQALSAIYRDRFDLTRPQWRVLAVLAREDALSPAEIARRAALDKMDFGRAVRLLERKRDLVRGISLKDKRTRLLSLTEQGRRLYSRIAPLALQRENELLSVLSPCERASLMGMIDRVSRHIRQIGEAGG